MSKLNFKKKYKDMTCRLCYVADESQIHLLNCPVILSDVNIRRGLEGHTYSDTFSAKQETQKHMIQTWLKIMKFRNSKLRNNANEDSSSQASPENSEASYSFVRHWV